MTRQRAIPAIDHREEARRALSAALAAESDPADGPLILATAGAGYAALCAASAVMTTGTRIARALEDIAAQLAKVSEAIR